MSAYIVNDDQVLIIAIAYHANGKGSYFMLKEIERTANELLKANSLSVNYRYNETGIETLEKKLTFDKLEQLERDYTNPVQILKLCQNLDYQSCEHPGYKESKAKEIIDLVINRQIMKLPGYDSFKWGL